MGHCPITHSSSGGIAASAAGESIRYPSAFAIGFACVWLRAFSKAGIALLSKVMVARFPVDEVPEGKPKTTSRARVPEAWERYLIGELATMPEGFTGVREQLELYGVLPEQKRAPARGRQPSRRPEVARPVPAAPGLDWQALRQWLALYCAHLLGLNRAPRTPTPLPPSPRLAWNAASGVSSASPSINGCGSWPAR
jgi:hypothetical protein